MRADHRYGRAFATRRHERFPIPAHGAAGGGSIRAAPAVTHNPERFGRRVLLSRVTLIKFTAKVKDRLIAAAAGVAVVVLTPLLGLIHKSLDETLHAGEPF